jgi:hypothetical protein
MANYSLVPHLKHDDYMTPKYAWENIKQYIPPNKVIWESFYGDGTSGKYLKELGFNVIHEPQLDFFVENKGDIIISNPPFSKSKEVMKRLKELNKPFIMLLPAQKINTSYMRDVFYNDSKLQIIIPRKRIHFLKHKDGKPIEGWKNACAFDCFYYCYKMDLPKDIVWLE